MIRRLTTLPLLAALVAPLASQDNVLVLVADDLGVDVLSSYGEGSNPAVTPNLDALAQSGVQFENAWANPVCSPTRACLHTGRYPLRTLVGNAASPGNFTMRANETTLPEVLDLAGSGYAHALIGKWHLGDDTGSGNLGPNVAGWSHFAGLLGGAVGDYFNWSRTENGVTAQSSVYATTQIVDDALAWIGGRSGPWVCVVAFNAPHTPFHRPPAALHTQALPPGNPNQNPVPFYRAAVEAMDTEIGRLLAGLGAERERTNIIFVGDNGTPRQVVEAPFSPNQAKGTLYEGGVNVPLIVAGPAAGGAPRVDANLVGAIDLFATVAELASVDASASVPNWLPLDGVSFVPHIASSSAPAVRTSVLAEIFQGDDFAGVLSSGGAALRNARYKLIRFYTAQGTSEEFYDLVVDPFEQNDLIGTPMGLAARQQLQQLRVELDDLRSPPSDLVAFAGGECLGSAGSPAATASGSAALGASYRIELVGAPPATLATLFVGASSETWGSLALPFPLSVLGGGEGCDLVVSGEFALSAITDGGGSSQIAFVVPSDVALVGGLVFHSWLIADAGAPGNPLGLTTSGGIAARLGF